MHLNRTNQAAVKHPIQTRKPLTSSSVMSFTVSLSNSDWTMFECCLNRDGWRSINKPAALTSAQRILPDKGRKWVCSRGCCVSITANRSWRRQTLEYYWLLQSHLNGHDCSLLIIIKDKKPDDSGLYCPVLKEYNSPSISLSLSLCSHYISGCKLHLNLAKCVLELYK